MARLGGRPRRGRVRRWCPDTAQGAIRRRVARLPQPAQHVLTVAAVLGQEAALGPGRRRWRGSTRTPSSPASTRGRPAGWRGKRVTASCCRHALVRDAVYDATPAAGAASCTWRPPAIPGLAPAEVAGHLLHAGASASTVDRVVRRHRGGRRRAAHDAQAWEDAARLYGQALDLGPEGDDASARGLLRGAGAALLDAADLERCAGALPRGRRPGPTRR